MAADQFDSTRPARLELRERDNVTIATLRGAADLADRDALQAAFADMPDHTAGLVMDLEDCEFIDSSILGLLFDVRRRLGLRGRPVRVVTRPGSPPHQVLELTGFGRAGPLERDVEAAAAAVLARTRRES